MIVHEFSQSGCTQDKEVWKKCGIKGRSVFELASAKLPIVPGFVIDAETCANLQKTDSLEFLKPSLERIGNLMGRHFGDPSNPLLLKLISSSNLSIGGSPSVFNVGLSSITLPGWAKIMSADEDKALFEYCYLLQASGEKVYGLDGKKFEAISSEYTGDLESRKMIVQKMQELVGQDKLPDDPFEQLGRLIRNMAKTHFDPDLDLEDNAVIIVQGMVFADLDAHSMVGHYCHRDIVSGEKKPCGEYVRNKYTLIEGTGQEINSLDEKYLQTLVKIGELIEKKFQDIFEIKFIVEGGILWLLNQTRQEKKSTQAHLKTLLDLNKEGVVSNREILKDMTPSYLSSLLYPVIDQKTVGNLSRADGGLSGSPGAAVGRVFFDTQRLMEVHREANLKGEDSRLILCVESSFAEDVKAIETGQAVIAVEGGYSSHAPVVARSIGKVAMINPKIRISGNSFELNGHVVKEGDYITLDVPIYAEPTVYFGEAGLISPDIEKNGLLELTKICRHFVDDSFVVRANADLPRDAQMCKRMGAYGIGLCRTEHMFFAEDRIQSFRQMILSENTEQRIQFLNKLEGMQVEDFYQILKISHPHPVAIRLLDAPLHEFLPRNSQALQDYMVYLRSQNLQPDQSSLQERIDQLSEFNPMLGHRGCRVGITYPEIYEMQNRAIFKAACRLKLEKLEVCPEILVPIIMNSYEMSMVRNGKKITGKFVKGITQVAEEVFKDAGVEVKYLVGSMVELPIAALGSGEIAKYADFLSFGTNDLTQTTFGLSRDDVNSFFPDYTEYDLLSDNPFRVLDHYVKELIDMSVVRSRLTRPGIKIGLCGEQGADPANIRFCHDIGMNYVSCSAYSIPVTLLAIAKMNIEQKEKEMNGND